MDLHKGSKKNVRGDPYDFRKQKHRAKREKNKTPARQCAGPTQLIELRTKTQLLGGVETQIRPLFFFRQNLDLWPKS